MEEIWFCLIKILLCTFMVEVTGDEEMATGIGITELDPVKEMLRRFDESPWTVFKIETTTSRWEKEMREYLEQHQDLEDIEKEMKIHGIVPDVLEEAPDTVLDVHYKDERNLSHSFYLGDIIEPRLCLQEPVYRHKTKVNTSYVHILIDPDHICTRFEQELDSSEEELIPTTTDDCVPKTFVHYLKVNIPHNNITKGGDVIVEYLPPHPPNGTGLHRYISLVYEQKKPYINYTEKRIVKTTAYDRDLFKISNFEKKYDLVQPAVAGNFFYARFDKAVPLIYARLHDVFI